MSDYSTKHTLLDQIKELSPWFHNIHLPGEIQTEPNHFLGDFPMCKWKEISTHLPSSLEGWTALDIGCNAGFYSFELAKRGANVTGIDSDPHYLSQAKWIASHLELKRPPNFQEQQIHDLAADDRQYDLVLFMGVFYHLRYPTLALDTVARKVKKLMVFQTLTTQEEDVLYPESDYPIGNRNVFGRPGWPKMAFIEKSFSGDPTNWWVPNHAAVEAMLRSSGFSEVNRIAHEIYLCTPPAGGVQKNWKWKENEWLSAVGRFS